MKHGLPSVRTFASRWSQGPLSSASPGPPRLGAGPELKCSLQPSLLLSFCPPTSQEKCLGNGATESVDDTS